MKESPLQTIAFNFRLHYLLTFLSYVSKVCCVLYAPFLFRNYDLKKTKGVAKISPQKHNVTKLWQEKLKRIHKREKSVKTRKSVNVKRIK